MCWPVCTTSRPISPVPGLCEMLRCCSRGVSRNTPGPSLASCGHPVTVRRPSCGSCSSPAPSCCSCVLLRSSCWRLRSGARAGPGQLASWVPASCRLRSWVRPDSAAGARWCRGLWLRSRWWRELSCARCTRVTWVPGVTPRSWLCTAPGCG